MVSLQCTVSKYIEDCVEEAKVTDAILTEADYSYTFEEGIESDVKSIKNNFRSEN